MYIIIIPCLLILTTSNIKLKVSHKVFSFILSFSIKLLAEMFLSCFVFIPFQYVCHMRTNIKYSPDKMWYIASFVRGMSVDEALKQLSFVLKKGAVDVKEVIQEAIEMAQKSHNVEYKSNLWIGKSL